jgi:hypothetical protein
VSQIRALIQRAHHAVKRRPELADFVAGGDRDDGIERLGLDGRRADKQAPYCA